MSRISPIDDGALHTVAEDVAARGVLDARLGMLASLVTLRRSAFHFPPRCEAARSAGLREAQIEAIDAEDWTDPSLNALEKAVFQYALTFDAGHGVTEDVFRALRDHLSHAEIAELSLLCATWGGIARIAIGLDYEPKA